ncbi:MAG: AtpZ/AtpI family protein [Proteobacteria bacterium]|nr:AtpZ/AtpI family protein [Pseudomonadota bacterium]
MVLAMVLALGACASDAGPKQTGGTLIGAAMGFALDKYLDTQPWLLLVGVLLGGAAGCLTVYRTVASIPPAEAGDENNRKDEKDI